MKPKNLFMVVCIVCAVCVAGCEQKVDTPQVSSIVVSERKGTEMDVDSLPESIEFVLQSGVLHVAHNNVLANCGTSEQLHIRCMISNDTLFLIEDTSEGPNCIYIFDWTYCISPFKAGIWNVKLNNDTTFMVTIDETTRRIIL